MLVSSSSMNVAKVNVSPIHHGFTARPLGVLVLLIVGLQFAVHRSQFAVGEALERLVSQLGVTSHLSPSRLPPHLSPRMAGGSGWLGLPPGAVEIPTLTLGSTDSPAQSRSRRSAASSNAILTGTRCTTFTKLPVAFSGGSKVKRPPVPPWKLSI